VPGAADFVHGPVSMVTTVSAGYDFKAVRAI
jgi:hypothetical protein